LFLYLFSGQPFSLEIHVTEAYTPNNAKDIISFHVDDEVGNEFIDNTNHTVICYIPLGTNLTSLSPIITVSPLATLMPWSGIPQDFSSPVIYRVTSQSGQAQNWLKNVNETNDTTGNINENRSIKIVSAVYPNPSLGELTIKFYKPAISITLILSDIKCNRSKILFLKM